MVNENLSLNVGSVMTINGVRFKVDGCILFKDNYGEDWTEYKIRSMEDSKVKWLSVDDTNEEYAIYSVKPYDKKYAIDKIESNGYKLVDSISATVMEYSGNVDVDINEKVFCKEYENEEGLIISIENWEDEFEFSSGYYIDREDIEILESNSNIRSHDNKNKAILGVIFGVVFIIGVLVFVFSTDKADKALSKAIGLIPNFTYETSITSDLNKEEKADVYVSDTTVESSTKLIIDEVQGNIEDVEENKEDGSVAILTKDEMALIYTGENSRTLVQVSLREYVYSSRSNLYMGSRVSNLYYRDYYYNRGYTEDKKRYTNVNDSYSGYKSGNFRPTDNNTYREYSNTIRQNSINTRTSSGDGISSGK